MLSQPAFGGGPRRNNGIKFAISWWGDRNNAEATEAEVFVCIEETLEMLLSRGFTPACMAVYLLYNSPARPVIAAVPTVVVERLGPGVLMTESGEGGLWEEHRLNWCYQRQGWCWTRQPLWEAWDSASFADSALAALRGASVAHIYSEQTLAMAKKESNC